jgi:hypothetical protein
MQADVGIPFSLHKNVLIFVSVSPYTGLSRSDFARPAVRVAGKPRPEFNVLPKTGNILFVSD